MSQRNQSLQSAALMARVAGLSYIIYTVAGLYITFGPAPSLSTLAGGGADTAEFEFLFRLGFAAEAVLYTFVAISAAAMYAVLNIISPGVSIMAAFCRLVEAAMGGTFIVLKYAAFAAITNQDLLAEFSDGERAGVMGLFAHLHGSALFFLLIPMAVGGVLFFSLFFRSRFIPRWLSAWGMLTYAIIGCVAAIVILFPALRENIMLFFLPGALFEWVVALWLFFVGINTEHWQGIVKANAHG